jgi:hypothetical protein
MKLRDATLPASAFVSVSPSSSRRSTWLKVSREAIGKPRNPRKRRSRSLPPRQAKRPQHGSRTSVPAKRNSWRHPAPRQDDSLGKTICSGRLFDRVRTRAFSVLIESEPKPWILVLTRFLHANRYPPRYPSAGQAFARIRDAELHGPAALLRGFGDLALQVAGLMITAELAQRCLVQPK